MKTIGKKRHLDESGKRRGEKRKREYVVVEKKTKQKMMKNDDNFNFFEECNRVLISLTYVLERLDNVQTRTQFIDEVQARTKKFSFSSPSYIS